MADSDIRKYVLIPFKDTDWSCNKFDLGQINSTTKGWGCITPITPVAPQPAPYSGRKGLNKGAAKDQDGSHSHTSTQAAIEAVEPTPNLKVVWTGVLAEQEYPEQNITVYEFYHKLQNLARTAEKQHKLGTITEPTIWTLLSENPVIKYMRTEGTQQFETVETYLKAMSRNNGKHTSWITDTARMENFDDWAMGWHPDDRHDKFMWRIEAKKGFEFPLCAYIGHDGIPETVTLQQRIAEATTGSRFCKMPATSEKGNFAKSALASKAKTSGKGSARASSSSGKQIQNKKGSGKVKGKFDDKPKGTSKSGRKPDDHATPIGANATQIKDSASNSRRPSRASSQAGSSAQSEREAIDCNTDATSWTDPEDDSADWNKAGPPAPSLPKPIFPPIPPQPKSNSSWAPILHQPQGPEVIDNYLSRPTNMFGAAPTSNIFGAAPTSGPTIASNPFAAAYSQAALMEAGTLERLKRERELHEARREVRNQGMSTMFSNSSASFNQEQYADPASPDPEKWLPDQEFQAGQKRKAPNGSISMYTWLNYPEKPANFGWRSKD